MRQSLYIIFTMDCERIHSDSTIGGPETWESSEKSIYGFCRTLLSRGMNATLFLTPEYAFEHNECLPELVSQGIDLGLHIHPQSLGDRRYSRCLGEYSRLKQQEILQQGVDMFVEAIGQVPKSFRPGNFSASDETFSVLNSLGFRQGSVSDPGRIRPDLGAIWENAFPDPHWANAENRLIPGDLPFLEIPVTTYPNQHHCKGLPQELRIESGSFKDWHLPIISYFLERMESDNNEFQCLCLFTHNYYEYDNLETDQGKALKEIIDYVYTLKDRFDVIPLNGVELRKRFLEYNHYSYSDA